MGRQDDVPVGVGWQAPYEHGADVCGTKLGNLVLRWLTHQPASTAVAAHAHPASRTRLCDQPPRSALAVSTSPSITGA
jgi:hypothetical protein